MKALYNPQVRSEFKTRDRDLKQSLDQNSGAVPSLVEKAISSQLPSFLQSLIPSSLQGLPQMSEPPILAEYSFPGGHLALQPFVHAIQSFLFNASGSFPNNWAGITWVAWRF